ncbi:hypothetical protein [Mogibacterium timidum]|uniref:Uncharacterized protein n=1 Tax=Mogibacterium timidum ATCC 33093 TaxID=1401079 RepID=X8IWL7_9FIRM|nr:hypothetical protein [Mogibacterium timidum]EUC53426.1 hypothetical protein HMPREF0581_0698 [Mogibacterium timidum ATCC 33093]
MAYINFKEIDNSNVTIESTASSCPDSYKLGTFSCEEFLQHLIGKGIVPVDEEEAPIPHELNTVRELYEICNNNPGDMQIMTDATAAQLIASRDNAEDNQSKFTGYKLLELRYYDCEPESQIINFKYPYTENKQFGCNFNVKMFINNPIFFNTVIRLLYEYSGPVLIYDYWRPVGMDLLGTVDGIEQIARV